MKSIIKTDMGLLLSCDLNSVYWYLKECGHDFSTSFKLLKNLLSKDGCIFVNPSRMLQFECVPLAWY